MPGRRYGKDPGGVLERVLEKLGWEGVNRFDLKAGRWVEPGLWEKGQSRLLVDEIGIFLYQFKNGTWVRTHGLSHDLIFPRKREIIFTDGSKLDLLTGEWVDQSQEFPCLTAS